MNLSSKQFQELLQKNKLVLSFIGMSNIGKTYWSERLSKFEFRHFNCDDLIEKKLFSELYVLGYSGINDVSLWMGQPYEKRFKENQRKYLNFEKEAMEDIFAELKNTKQNVVIDTTGSFVHLNEKTCLELKERSLIVYIKATDSMREKMFERYVEDPKPVVFGDIFNPQEGESGAKALRRCYPILLENRSKLYEKYADVIIPCEFIDMKMDIKDFISLINKNCEIS
jgi:shikimate kinase